MHRITIPTTCISRTPLRIPWHHMDIGLSSFRGSITCRKEDRPCEMVGNVLGPPPLLCTVLVVSEQLCQKYIRRISAYKRPAVWPTTKAPEAKYLPSTKEELRYSQITVLLSSKRDPESRKLFLDISCASNTSEWSPIRSRSHRVINQPTTVSKRIPSVCTSWYYTVRS